MCQLLTWGCNTSTDVSSISSESSISDTSSSSSIDDSNSESDVSDISSETDVNDTSSESDVNNTSAESDVNNTSSENDVYVTNLESDVNSASSEDDVNDVSSESTISDVERDASDIGIESDVIEVNSESEVNSASSEDDVNDVSSESNTGDVESDVIEVNSENDTNDVSSESDDSGGSFNRFLETFDLRLPINLGVANISGIYLNIDEIADFSVANFDESETDDGSGESSIIGDDINYGQFNPENSSPLRTTSASLPDISISGEPSPVPVLHKASSEGATFDNTCPVCLRDGSEIRTSAAHIVITNCNHKVCSICFRRIMRLNARCPLCRTVLHRQQCRQLML